MFLLGALKEGLRSKRSHGMVKQCNRPDRHRVSQDHKTSGRTGVFVLLCRWRGVRVCGVFFYPSDHFIWHFIF